MKPLVCVYCEGTDTKLAVLSKEKDKITIHRTVSGGLTPAASDSSIPDLAGEDFGSDISFDDFGSESGTDISDVQSISSKLAGIQLNKSEFIPVLTEPVMSYHLYEGEKGTDKNKLIQSVVKDIQTSKNIFVDDSSIDCTELNDKSVLSVFVEQDIPCVDIINALAGYRGRRYFKIPTFKSAELSLAHYVSKTTKFFPEDFSLIIYIGKEYSKLIFLEGQKLKHLGATLDIGTKNLHTYDVYFSKILLEMENGGIPKLDNIILCGEDRSENLILSFYGTFPEANVSELKFEDFITSELNEEAKHNLSEYSIPIAAAVEYFDELDKTYTGIHILPKYIRESQKTFQFGWHSYAMLAIIFAVTLFFTIKILDNFKEIDNLDHQITELTIKQQQNQAIVREIEPLNQKINSFDATQAILDSASVGTEVFSNMIMNISDFVERRRNFWMTRIEVLPNKQVTINGYSLSRSVLTEFAETNKSTMLKNILYDPLREKSAFSYTLNFNIY
jgi:hypothetical protein